MKDDLYRFLRLACIWNLLTKTFIWNQRETPKVCPLAQPLRQLQARGITWLKLQHSNKCDYPNGVHTDIKYKESRITFQYQMFLKQGFLKQVKPLVKRIKSLIVKLLNLMKQWGVFNCALHILEMRELHEPQWVVLRNAKRAIFFLEKKPFLS